MPNAGIINLLYQREFDREYKRWSVSRAVTAELSAGEVYALIAELIMNAEGTGPAQDNEDTTQSIGRND